MSKSANAGELQIPVYFKKCCSGVDADGFQIEDEVNVAGQDDRGNDVPFMCKWVNAHGSEVWSAMQLQLRDPATITTRYSSAIDDETLVVYRGSDPEPYEVISIDNVEQKNVWLEIKVQRKVSAR